MCYPCTHCGRCGKYCPDSPYYTPPPGIPCLQCGTLVDPVKGVCEACGYVAFSPPGTSSENAVDLRDADSAGGACDDAAASRGEGLDGVGAESMVDEG